ncbi:uncharacterized protein MYCFIDRAFT_174399 [Pseudocercospora fijiensis CIRAD86]|uniref:Uncharacterized protein n=1 Tax=Pseudocercospora fijiensis (strain CIRAD86) TaxID=383855 RepID=M3B0E7_PSEFD|nr:uncharacterized protein MYCFIDRAFT_174399 [Pseudocercospora fijiensis CIRAD86]EME82883.1 hypothetical protein MYCFIDRAFT_174399 [Pseudocercospora fijiensis CIRAD86]
MKLEARSCIVNALMHSVMYPVFITILESLRVDRYSSQALVAVIVTCCSCHRAHVLRRSAIAVPERSNRRRRQCARCMSGHAVTSVLKAFRIDGNDYKCGTLQLRSYIVKLRAGGRTCEKMIVPDLPGNVCGPDEVVIRISLSHQCLILFQFERSSQGSHIESKGWHLVQEASYSRGARRLQGTHSNTSRGAD